MHSSYYGENKDIVIWSVCWSFVCYCDNIITIAEKQTQ